ncbi:MAG TPA: FAD-dependent monooxygenase [Candidatus Acidoferrum sp.]|nr:FAD-dependent monooxygenase [Candidatus Acidoferrum sp.]
MAASKPITIVGGGLAGLSLGIGLRQRQIPVTIIEAGNYPRHRACGEFISGRGLQSLARLGLEEELIGAGAIPARTAAFFTATRGTAPHELPGRALCLSRYILDQSLARTFQHLGGKLVTGRRWRENEFSEGVVRAAGRRPQTEADGTRWFGLKIHARNVSLGADLEMHFATAEYVGLCKLAGDEVNVCGLFRRDHGRPTPVDARELLRGQPGSILNRRLAGADFDETSFSSTAGISLRAARAAAHPEICVGDAITMIPPLTGNGMSMAFESAELATEPLAAWSRGESSWLAAKSRIARACDILFARRLGWATRLQPMFLSAAWQKPLLLLSRSQWFWRIAFGNTR